jgi:hypothetical protein
MSVDSPSDSQPKTKRARTSQLRVVIDTNALYVTSTNIGSASDLVRQEIVNVITDAKYPDLDILWYIPEIVRHERQYQMQTEALKLRSPINRIERLLGHNLALTDSVLLDHVKTKIEEKEKELGLQEIKLDHNLIDWPKLIHAAAYRSPPFEAGEKEKGFRDALVAESFLQLLSSSPKTPSLCRVVLITSDTLLTQAVKERITDSANASVLANVEELKGLINTIVSNVAEDFIAQIKPKAAKLFFVSREDKETVFYREKIRERLKETFNSELEAKPQGTVFRENGTWYIENPNFSRKEGRRVFWTTRIEIEVDAGTVTQEDAPTSLVMSSLDPSAGTLVTGSPQPEMTFNALTNALTGAYGTNLYGRSQYAVVGAQSWPGTLAPTTIYMAGKRVVTLKGRDIYEVLWSTEVTMAKELKKALIESIRHVEVSCQPV